MKVVFDTNVLVSAAIQRGTSYELLDHLMSNASIQLIICKEIIEELSDVLTTRPRLRRWISLPEAKNYIKLIELSFVVLENPNDVQSVSRDSEDDYLLALALREHADHIVSGDKDLLVLHSSHQSIITPAEFAGILGLKPKT